MILNRGALGALHSCRPFLACWRNTASRVPAQASKRQWPLKGVMVHVPYWDHSRSWLNKVWSIYHIGIMIL